MSLTVTFPSTTLPNSSEASEVYAAHNEIIVTAERKDYLISGISNSSGFIKITLTASASTEVEVGDTIYYKSGANVGVATVTAYNGSTEITIDKAYSTVTSGGYVNLITKRPNYYAKVSVGVYNFATALYETFVQKFTPNGAGVLEIDLHEMIHPYLNDTDSFDHSTTDYKDLNLLRPFIAGVQECWKDYEGSGGSWFNVMAIKAINPPMYADGASMKAYEFSSDGSDKAKFLTDFEVMTFFSGMPFEVGFIERQANQVNDKKIYLSTTLESGTVTTANINLTNSIWGLRRIRPIQNFVLSAKTVEFYVGDGTNEYTERKKIIMNTCPPKNPLCLKWLNSKGAWDYFTFSVTQTRGISQQLGAQFQKYQALPSRNNTGKLITKTSRPEITFGAEQLTTEQMKGLESLINSPSVYMLVSNDPSPVWQYVILSKNKYQFNNKLSRHSFEATIELMDIGTQTM